VTSATVTVYNIFMGEWVVVCVLGICRLVLEYEPDITIDEGIYRVFEVDGEIVFADELGEDVADGAINRVE